MSGYNYEPNPFLQFILVPANNLPQTTPNAIANDCTAETA
jgi:hypothetical protein